MAKDRRVGPQRIGWDFFGKQLRQRREAAGLTQQALAGRVFVSPGYISQFEQGIRKPQLDLAKMFDKELGAGDFFEQMWRELIDSSPVAGHFTDTAELEPTAQRICEYAPQLVPGLLQTPEYARAIFLAGQPLLSEEEVEEKVRTRIDRTRLITDPESNTRPVYWAILDEAVIRRPVGTDEDMAGQLSHIADLMRKGHVLAQVLSFAARAHALQEGFLTLMSFADAPPVAYVEGPWTGQMFDDPVFFSQAQMAYDLVRAAALSREASLLLIEQAAKDYRHEH